MKRFTPTPPPEGWEAKVLAPGRAWLARGDNARSERPKQLWAPWGPELARAFSGLCAYAVMYCPNGAADHYIPWARLRGTPDAELAYHWSNLRYADPWFNSARRAADVPDPFLVSDDWFELRLPSLELVATDRVPPDERARVQAALRWLGKHETILRWRQHYWDEYQAGELSLAGLDRDAPLLSRALRANPEYLRPPDR